MLVQKAYLVDHWNNKQKPQHVLVDERGLVFYPGTGWSSAKRAGYHLVLLPGQIEHNDWPWNGWWESNWKISDWSWSYMYPTERRPFFEIKPKWIAKARARAILFSERI